jgi:hypothetical protein
VNRPPNRRRGLRPRTADAGTCGFCEQPFTPHRYGPYIVESCIPFDVQGLPRVPHVWPDDLLEDPPPGVTAATPCQCGTPVGGYHHYECDLEICPWADTHPDAGEQLLCCGCLEDPDPAA